MTVNPAYSSQQCPICHLAHRDNRRRQETFSCMACGYTVAADINTAQNLKNRADDAEMLKCKDKVEIKALLAAKHRVWLEKRLLVVQPPV